MGMADHGQLPKFLTVRSRFGTPTLSIVLSASGVLLTSQLDFDAIIELVCPRKRTRSVCPGESQRSVPLPITTARSTFSTYLQSCSSLVRS